jgi:hypothetical protein
MRRLRDGGLLHALLPVWPGHYFYKPVSYPAPHIAPLRHLPQVYSEANRVKEGA